MSVTIGLVANIYNEANALPGWLETHLPFFDDVRVLHAGPNGAYSTDGTLEILSKWNIPVEFCAIDEGFGVVRTKAIHMSPCEWVMILDADERFYQVHRLLTCGGQATPHSEVDAILQEYDFRDLSKKTPNWETIAKLGRDLVVDFGETFDQGKLLRSILSGRPKCLGGYDAVAVIRRHWHDFSFRKPTQNWFEDQDLQMRLVRNDPKIRFDVVTRMHERLTGADSIFYADLMTGPFFDHFHFSMKRMEMEQRSHDIAIYDAINEGKVPPKWEEFKS